MRAVMVQKLAGMRAAEFRTAKPAQAIYGASE
jgi:hypothetical protein